MFLRLCIVGLTVAVVTASQAENELIRKLFQHYGTQSRPVENPNTTLLTKLRFTVIDISDVDLDEGQMTVEGWLQMQWKDHQLRWNSSEHGNVQELHVPSENVWKPDMMVYNGRATQVDNTLTIVYPDGSVMWVPPVTTRVTCDFKPLWYPFDEQKCTIIFGSWTYDSKKIDLQIAGDADEKAYPNSDWTLVSVEHTREEKKYNCCENTFPSVRATVTIRRRSCKFLRAEVLPMVTMVGLGLLTLLVPTSRADLRLLILTLLIGSAFVHLSLLDTPEGLTALSFLNAHLMLVLIGLFLCNCVHLVIVRGHCTFSLLTKLASLVTRTNEEKSENLISNDEQRCQRTIDTIFSVPLIFLAIGATVLFMATPLF